METLHTILVNLQDISHALAGIPERKLMPIAAIAPILIFGSMFLWTVVRFYLFDEKTN